MEWDGKLGWATIVTVALFGLSYLLRWALDWYEQRQRTHRFYIALLTELKLNVEALEEIVGGLPSSDIMNKHLSANQANRPHIISTYISDIYKSNISLLPDLPDIIIRNLILFYSNLEFIDALVKSFQDKSFETISKSGRELVYRKLVTEIEAAANQGRPLLDQIRLTLRISDHR